MILENPSVYGEFADQTRFNKHTPMHEGTMEDNCHKPNNSIRSNYSTTKNGEE
jgi:hypothetical protein